MLTKNREIEIDKSDIFKNDILDREKPIRNLSELIMSYTEPFVLSINADWGAGKTTFVKLWKAYIEKEYDVKSIYFSAWEDDFSKEPLLSILGEINTYIDKIKKPDEDTPVIKNYEELKNKYDAVKKVSSKVIRRGLAAFLKGATSGFIDMDKGFETAFAAISEAAAKEMIEKYNDDKGITQEFKSALESLLEELDADKPLVIFIDELDRCHPLYSIELLERIKHLFSIDRIIFVLSIDKTQLSESIKSQYGNIDTENYLRRFIDLEFKLSNPKAEEFCNFLNQKYDLYQVIENKDLANNEYGHMQIILPLLEPLSLTLREIEHLFLRLNIIARTIEQQHMMHHIHNPIDIFYIITFVLVLKMKFPEIYRGKDAEGILLELSKLRESSRNHSKIYDFFLTKIQNKYENNHRLLEKINFAIIKIEFSDKFNFDSAIE